MKASQFTNFLFAILFSCFFLNSKALAQKNPALKYGEPLPANAFIELAKLVNPAVVNISTSTNPRWGRGQRDPFFDMLERFYGIPMTPPQGRPQQSLGTGFVIREDGLIVTNNHVIAGADVIQVQFNENSQEKIEAELVGSDDRTDIALIKIKKKGRSWPTVQLGSSKETEVGEWVAAFGNPFGNGHTMTKGIISAKGRDISEINRFPLLQTDTPINPGNSGGPLVNLKGQVIGVNSAIDARAQGIGFAIPIDEVKSIIPQLEKSGRIKAGYLGVGLGDLNEYTAAQLDLKSTDGALIAGVEKGSPADRAGLEPYDVVTEFAGKKVTNANQLRDAVAGTEIGSTVGLKVLRNGKERNLKITVSERPDNPRALKRNKSFGRGESAPHDLGFEYQNINPELRKSFDLADDLGTRPVITEVRPGSAASRAGLSVGDVILDINRKEAKSSTDVPKLLKKGTNTLRVVREGEIIILVM